MDERQGIKNPPNKYFHIMLNMADDDLDVYEYRLLGHYIRVGTTFEGTRKTAKKTRMSLGKVVSTRNALEAKGYIRMEKPENQADTVKIFIIDRMKENIERYSDCSPDEHPVHDMNTRRSPDERKKNTDKKNQEEKDIAPEALKPAKPYYDAIALHLDIHGGQNMDVQKMLEGKATKAAYKPYNMNPPVSVEEFEAWGKVAKVEMGAYKYRDPAKINGSITKFRSKKENPAPAETPILKAPVRISPEAEEIARQNEIALEKRRADYEQFKAEKAQAERGE